MKKTVALNSCLQLDFPDIQPPKVSGPMYLSLYFPDLKIISIILSFTNLVLSPYFYQIMTIGNARLRQTFKRMGYLMLGLLLLTAIVLSISWYVLRSDHAYVIRKAQEMALTKLNADLQLEGYQLEWVKPFPTIRFEVRGLNLSSTDSTRQPVLKISNGTSQFQPWHLLTGNFNMQPVQLDSVWLFVHKDSLNISNLFMKDSNSDKKEVADLDIELDELPLVQINFLDFHYQDDYRQKWHWAKLSHAAIQPQRQGNSEWSVQLISDAYFKGLNFKQEDGPFLRETQSSLNLNLSLHEHGRVIKLDTSYLQVDQDVYQLQGKFFRADTNQMHLQISHDGVLMADVLPLLSDNIQRDLSIVNVDRRIQAKFFLDRVMVPGRKAAIDVQFFTDSASITLKGTTMTAATLRGKYTNDCDEDGIGSSETSCVTIQQLDGDIFGLIPAELHGKIDNLKDPQVAAAGKVQVLLPKLNELLAPKGKVTFLDGNALVNFQYSGSLKNILNAPFDEHFVKLRGDAAFEDVRLEMEKGQTPLPSLCGQMSFDELHTMIDDISLQWMGANIQLTGQLSNLPEFVFYDNQSLHTDLRLHFDRLDLNRFIKDDLPQKNSAGNKGKSMNYERLEEVTRKVAANINGLIRLEVDKIIYDTLFATNLQTSFRFYSPLLPQYADSAMIQIDQLQANFMGKSPLRATLQLSQHDDPDVLLDVDFDDVVEVAKHWLSKEILISKGAASLHVSARVPFEALLQRDRLLTEVRYKGRVNFDQLDARLSAFEWPVRSVSGGVLFDSEQLHFTGLQFQYEGSPFELNGKVDQYAFFRKGYTKKANVDLQLFGGYIDLRRKNTQIQDHAPTEKNTRPTPPDLFRTLDTVYHYGSGKIELHLDSINAPTQTFKQVRLLARLIADEHDQEKYQLQLDSFKFGMGTKDIVQGRLSITDPDAPKIDAEVKAYLSLLNLGKILPSEYLEMQGGILKMNLRYQSPLYDTLNAKNYLLHAVIDGTAELVDGKMFYNYRDFYFDNIFGHFRFDQRALYIRDLDLDINKNRLFAHGQSTDFFPFFILPDRRAHLELNVGSPRFDFGAFTAPHGLGKDTLAIDEPAVSKIGYIDLLLDKGSLEMDTDFDEIVYREFEAHNVKGNISLQPDTVELSGLRMDVAKGQFTINGAITDVVHHEPKMRLGFQLVETDLREIFRQFENFGQDHLGYKNIEGNATAEIEFKADINSNYSVLPETMYGDMRIKLSGGELKEVGALKKVSGFLFRKRQMEKVLIDTLEIFPHIRGTDLYVDQFYVHSSSFDFGVVGVYSLGKNNKTRILFGVPVSNLFRPYLTREELNQDDSERKGIKIFIEVRQKKDKLRFRWKIPLFGRKKYKLKKQDQEKE